MFEERVTVPLPLLVSVLLPVRAAATVPLWRAKVPLLLLTVPLVITPLLVRAMRALVMTWVPRFIVPVETLSEPLPSEEALLMTRVPPLTKVPPK